MTQQLWPDHRGLFSIKTPDDMPLSQVAMLQETIREAWASYGGDHDNPEQFWNHLVGSGMTDVPRETSLFQVDVVYRVNGGAARTAQRTVEAENWSDARAQVEDKLRAAMPNDRLTFGNFSGGIVPDGGSVVTDVPRETSPSDDAMARLLEKDAQGLAHEVGQIDKSELLKRILASETVDVPRETSREDDA
jgi:hypothetical protein